MIPTRQGPRPQTEPDVPHQQLDQNPNPELYRKTAELLFSLPNVKERPSRISVPGARALCLDETRPLGPREAFMVGREFAHLHPSYDGSLHLTLPTATAKRVIDAGWGEWHPMVLRGVVPPNLIMVYAPRNDEELKQIEQFVRSSLDYASGN